MKMEKVMNTCEAVIHIFIIIFKQVVIYMCTNIYKMRVKQNVPGSPPMLCQRDTIRRERRGSLGKWVRDGVMGVTGIRLSECRNLPGEGEGPLG